MQKPTHRHYSTQNRIKDTLKVTYVILSGILSFVSLFAENLTLLIAALINAIIANRVAMSTFSNR